MIDTIIYRYNNSRILIQPESKEKITITTKRLVKLENRLPLLKFGKGTKRRYVISRPHSLYTILVTHQVYGLEYLAALNDSYNKVIDILKKNEIDRIK